MLEWLARDDRAGVTALLDRALFDAAEAVKITGKKGTVTLEYRLSMVGGDLAVSAKVTSTVPKLSISPGQMTLDEAT